MAVRRLRAGFVYLWQDQGPLKRYGVSRSGQFKEQALDEDETLLLNAPLSGLALENPRCLDALQRIPPNPERCKALSDSSAKRREHMRHIALRTVANELQAKHCPPLEQAAEVMAELLPDTFARALKADLKRGAEDTDALGEAVMKDPTPRNIKAYTDAMHRARERERVLALHPDVSDQPPGEWSAEPWEGQGTQDWLDGANAQTEGLFAVFACLDDDLCCVTSITNRNGWRRTTKNGWARIICA
jgi:hypothetical protein